MSPRIPFPVVGKIGAWYRLQNYLAAQAAKVKASATDLVGGYLIDKLVAGANVTLTLKNLGGNEQVEIAAVAGGGGTGCDPQTPWTIQVDAIVAGLDALAPTSVLTTTGVGDLQTAINALGPGDVLEVRTDATYDPVTLPAVVGGYTIKAGDGFVPKISGLECVRLANGAEDVTFSGFELYDGTTSLANAKGAFVTFATEFALVQRIVFANLYLHDVVGTAAGVLLSYFWVAYATPPDPATQMSSKLAFVACRFVNAGDWDIEGCSLGVRGFDQLYVDRCDLDGDGKTTRATQIQNCFNTIIQDSVAYNVAAGNGGEGFKVDQLGAWESTYGAWSTGVIRRCVAHDVAQGFDVDDFCAFSVQGCTAYDCAEQGFDLDNDSTCAFECCSAYSCPDGFWFEAGSQGSLRNCFAFECSSNNYRMDNAYVPNVTNLARTDASGGPGS